MRMIDSHPGHTPRQQLSCGSSWT